MYLDSLYMVVCSDMRGVYKKVYISIIHKEKKMFLIDLFTQEKKKVKKDLSRLRRKTNTTMNVSAREISNETS